MKSAFKHLLAVTAFAAASAAQAQSIPFPPTLTSGSGTLAFSAEAQGAIGSAGVSLAAPSVIPEVAGLTAGGNANAASYASNVLNLNFSSVTTSGDHVSTLSSPGSFLRLRRTLVDDSGVLGTRYSVYLTGFELDLNQSTIYANVFAAADAGAATSFGRTAIFTATQVGIVGGTEGRIVFDVGPDGALGAAASGSLAGSLRLNGPAGELILSNLGLADLATQPNDPVNRLWREANWGTVSFSVPAVPEPSTYAMFGFGLLTMGALARRRQAA